MDETTRTRISIICLGLIAIATGVYLTFSSLSSASGIWDIWLSGIPLFVGLGIIRYGYNFNPENKPVKRQKTVLGSDARKVALTGLVMFFMGLGFISLGFYSHSGPLIIGASLFGFVGFVLMIVGRITGLTERENQDAPDSSRPIAF